MERLRGTCISIHASAREATHPNAFLYLFSHDFNPRLREGGDKKEWKVRFMGNISIHASAREATLSAMQIGMEMAFQSTPPRGRRLEK